MTISFDIFDTIISRDVLFPDDIYYFVGKFAYSKKLISINPSKFRKIRINYDKLLRSKNDREEIDFNEIYELISHKLNLKKINVKKIKNIEKSIEKNSIYVIQENFRKTNNNIIFISDMYLDKFFIEKILLKKNIKFLDLFVSSKFLKTKSSGKLFLIVKKKYDLKEHIGDDFWSDYMIPKILSLNSNLYRNSKPNRYEKVVYNSKTLATFEQRSVIAGSMKKTRLEKFYKKKILENINNLSSKVIAPFLFFFVYWVLKKAIQKKVDKLYFISRDGEILFKIAKFIINKNKIKNIKLKYIYGSRKAWHIASIDKHTRDFFQYVMEDYEKISINTICERFEIKYDTIKNSFKKIAKPSEKLSKKQIKKIFSSNKIIRKSILQCARRKRKILAKYLKQEGFEKKSKIGLVDIGWKGRLQNSLSRTLNIQKMYPNQGIHGFYGFLKKPSKNFLNDKKYCYFNSKKHKTIYNYPSLFEDFVSANHGRCIGYSANNNIIYPMLECYHENKKITVQQDSIIRFAKNILNSTTKYKINYFKLNHKKLTYSLLKMFLTEPRNEEAQIYKNKIVFSDLEEKIPIRLCPNLSTILLAKIIIKNYKLDYNVWIEGSIRNSFNVLISSVLLKLFKVYKSWGLSRKK